MGPPRCTKLEGGEGNVFDFLTEEDKTSCVSNASHEKCLKCASDLWLGGREILKPKIVHLQ